MRATLERAGLTWRGGVGLGVAALALALLAGPVGASGRRIVAVGDIHGEYEGFVRILAETGLVDAEGSWAGGGTTLVQTGDFTDRGVRVRDVMDLLQKLQRQARASGGEVIVLLGNHEVMNLTDSFRDFNPRAYAAFADEDSQERRREAWRELAALRREEGRDETGLESEAEWMRRHPLGRLEYQEAISPRGEYGRWLRELPVVVELEGVVFMHAGLDPDLELRELDDVNGRIHEELESYVRAKRTLVEEGLVLPFFDLPAVEDAVVREAERLMDAGGAGGLMRSVDLGRREALLTIARMPEWWSFLPSGPLWFRGYAEWPETEGLDRVAALRRRFDVDLIVVAHSVLQPPGRVRARFGGSVFMIDTGMLKERYGGRPSALEIDDGMLTAFYEDEREVLVEGAAAP